MSIRNRILLALAVLMVAGCTVTPPYEFDRQASFAELKTFQWLEPNYDQKGVNLSHPVLESPLLGQRVERAVTSALESKGYRRVDSDPDFYVTYHTAESETERRHGSYVQLGYGRYSPYFGTGVLLDMTPRTFREGTLIIDIVEAETDDLIWRGWRDAYLTQRNFEQERVDETVREILTVFPPDAS